VAEVKSQTLVDGRYRVQSRIGSGGMADVYQAEDTHLGREVALKILHRRFAQDAEFVERFRREASAAAGLQHPNVVAVYDRGSFDGTWYIAMERVKGRTLKQLIGEEAPLDQRRAIDLTVQVLQAASFAHKRGVVHRDFKPHNVIVGPDDSAKVTDFGIASAGASEMTETGSIMGTAQYLSPEQAQGQRVDARSDLYSIGIMLYELLTARVPFGGESAVSIALKHVSEPAPLVSDLRPDIHPELDAIVARALVKDPNGRFQSAEEFVLALDHARAEISAGRVGEHTSRYQRAGPPPVPPVGPPLYDEYEEEPERRGPRWPWITLALVILALVAVAIFVVTDKPEQVTVPSVAGLTVDKATQRLERRGFHVEKRLLRNEAEAGTVLDSDPRRGEEADKGSKVTLIVSSGPGSVAVDDVQGLSRQDATRTLEKHGFKVDMRSKPSKKVESGKVITTTPKPGALAKVGSTVTLVLSTGPKQVQVPGGLVGLTQSSAQQQLEAADFQVAIKEVNDDAPVGQVIQVDPTGNSTVDEGSRVTLTVSKGPKQVDVPDVSGLPLDEARSKLKALKFKVALQLEDTGDPAQDKVVDTQSPEGGSQAHEGDTVTLVVFRFKDTTQQTPPDGTSP
jgi:serine/threonine-protein kinase